MLKAVRLGLARLGLARIISYLMKVLNSKVHPSEVTFKIFVFDKLRSFKDLHCNNKYVG
jgi:hypothetical protein